MTFVIVTGARGFVGRRLIQRLRADGREIRTLSRGSDADIPYPDDGRFDPRSFAGCEAIVHLAAHLPASMEDPSEAERCFQVNALHTLSLLQASSTASVPYVVYVSSGNAYAPGGTPRQEEDPLYPDQRATCYLLSKLAGDVLVKSFDSRGGLSTAVVRPSSIYGPGMAPSSMIGTFVARALRKEPIELRDGGAFDADFVYVDDVIEAIVALVAGKTSGVFNAGSGARTTSKETARAVARVFGRGEIAIRVSGDSLPCGFAPLDSTRIRLLLGIQPRSLDEGLRSWAAELLTDLT